MQRRAPVFTDLALGLRVVGAGVVEPDAEAAELDFEGDPAATAG
jgi:hypothetical protein